MVSRVERAQSHGLARTPVAFAIAAAIGRVIVLVMVTNGRTSGPGTAQRRSSERDDLGRLPVLQDLRRFADLHRAPDSSPQVNSPALDLISASIGEKWRAR
jgi:hypothetical protein